MSAFGPWLFDVEKRDATFAPVGNVSIDFTAPDAGGNGGSFAFSYTPDDNSAVIGPITINPVRSQSDGNLFVMRGRLDPALVIPAADAGAGTYARGELYFNPANNAFWGTLFARPNVMPGDPEVNVEASQNPPVPIELKEAAKKAGVKTAAKATSY